MVIPPRSRYVPPEAPQIGILALLLGRCGHWHGDVLAGVEGTGDAADRAALAGRVDALEDQDQRTFREALAAGEAGELALILVQFDRVELRGELLRQIQVADQLEVVDDRGGRRRDCMLRRHGLARAGRVQRIEQDLANSEIAIVCVLALDDVPGGDAGRGFPQQGFPAIVRPAIDAIGIPVFPRYAPGAFADRSRARAAVLSAPLWTGGSRT